MTRCKFCWREIEWAKPMLVVGPTMWVTVAHKARTCSGRPNFELHRPYLPDLHNRDWVEAWLADRPYRPPGFVIAA